MFVRECAIAKSLCLSFTLGAKVGLVYPSVAPLERARSSPHRVAQKSGLTWPVGDGLAAVAEPPCPMDASRQAREKEQHLIAQAKGHTRREKSVFSLQSLINLWPEEEIKTCTILDFFLLAREVLLCLFSTRVMISQRKNAV